MAPQQALPNTLDVQVSISKAQTAQRAILSTLCVVVLHNAAIPDVVRFYSDPDSVTNDWGADSSAAKAADAFFAQSPRPDQIAIGNTTQNFVDIKAELTAIASAAKAVGQNIYGWCLEAGLRHVDTQVDAAEWALAHTAIMPLVTNDLNAYDPAYTTDIASTIGPTKNKRVECLYHDSINAYPDVSILAYMLSVDYTQQDSTVTAKFAVLPGVPTVNLDYNKWLALKAKGYNTYTYMDNGVSTFREGTTSDSTYFLDSVINLDNLSADLAVNVYNVFVRNKKVPYTREGQLMIVDACRDTGEQYVYNKALAPREVADPSKKSGVKVLPAYEIIPVPISSVSAAQRASRVGPAVQMIVQEAGAIHSVAVNVQVVD